jgi:hypothetical protein
VRRIGTLISIALIVGAIVAVAVWILASGFME